MVDQQQPKPPDLPEIVGPSLETYLDRLAKWKDLDEPILFTGETGTGKELFARYLAHKIGRPFYPMNCIGIPENLFESELFGHEKGAFTGATSKRMGLIETAGDGTVFLDEIGDLPDYTLGKILRLIQFKEFRPVGSNNTKHAKCRFLAASNKEGIRADLLERFTAFEVPPLRVRTEDLYFIIPHFLTKVGYKRISVIAALILMEYDWPGNVRELEKACTKFMVERESDVLTLRDVETGGRFGASLSKIVKVEKWLIDQNVKSPFSSSESPIIPDLNKTIIDLDDSFASKFSDLVKEFMWSVYKIPTDSIVPYPPCDYSTVAQVMEDLYGPKKDPWDDMYENYHAKLRELRGEDPVEVANPEPGVSFSKKSGAELFDSTTPDELKCKWLDHHLDKGMTKEEIAVRAGRSKATIYKWIKSFGLDS